MVRVDEGMRKNGKIRINIASTEIIISELIFDSSIEKLYELYWLWIFIYINIFIFMNIFVLILEKVYLSDRIAQHLGQEVL